MLICTAFFSGDEVLSSPSMIILAMTMMCMLVCMRMMMVMMTTVMETVVMTTIIGMIKTVVVMLSFVFCGMFMGGWVRGGGSTQLCANHG